MIYQLWKKTQSLPFGTRIFSKLLSMKAPYTGSIHPHVLELKPGYCKVEVKDRGSLRNHLNSIHAVALMNIGEVSSGLALIVSVPDNARAILVGFEIEFIKKARGTLTSECHCEIITSNETRDQQIEAIIKNTDQQIVAKAKATWKIGPKK